MVIGIFFILILKRITGIVRCRLYFIGETRAVDGHDVDYYETGYMAYTMQYFHDLVWGRKPPFFHFVRFRPLHVFSSYRFDDILFSDPGNGIMHRDEDDDEHSYDRNQDRLKGEDKGCM